VPGFKKNTILVKGAEKFFERENRRQEKVRRKAARKGTGGAKRAAVVLVLLLVVAGLGAFMWSQQRQIGRLRSARDGEISGLKSQIATLSLKLEESDKQVQTLKENITVLERQVEAEQSQRIRAEAVLRGIAKRKAQEDGKTL
jgi:uncharacterized protein HemX